MSARGIKVPFKLPLWQTIGMVASLLKMADLGWAGPDYTTLCRRQKPRRNQMHCLNPLGQSLMARGFERQVAEIQIRIAVLNRNTALGMPVTKPVG